MVLGNGQGEDEGQGDDVRAIQDHVCMLNLTKCCSLMAFQARGSLFEGKAGTRVRGELHHLAALCQHPTTAWKLSGLEELRALHGQKHSVKPEAPASSINKGLWDLARPGYRHLKAFPLPTESPQ